MKKITKQSLKKLEHFLQIFSCIIIGIPLLLWLVLKTSYYFIMSGVLISNLLLVIFVIFLYREQKRQQDNFLKDAFSYWKFIALTDIIFLLWFLF